MPAVTESNVLGPGKTRHKDPEAYFHKECAVLSAKGAVTVL